MSSAIGLYSGFRLTADSIACVENLCSMFKFGKGMLRKILGAG